MVVVARPPPRYLSIARQHLVPSHLAPSLPPFLSRIRSSHPFGKRPPVLARPLERWRHVVHRLTALAEVRQVLRRVGRFAIVLYARPFPGFVRAAGHEELDPVLDSVLGEDEYNTFKLLLRNPL